MIFFEKMSRIISFRTGCMLRFERIEMRESHSQEVTRLLLAWRQGKQDALDELIPIVYEELRQQAHRHLRREQKGHSLQTTALINETYLRLLDCKRVGWKDRAHFFAVTAQMMRRILVDYARSRRAQKRGGDLQKTTLDQILTFSIARDSDLVALDDALNELAVKDERRSRVVELRFFGGLSIEETAEVLGVSPDTVVRDWRLAKAWLAREVKKSAEENL
jgi:RNA polymerase sigma-70 factor (ECF subfamily)